MPRTNCCLGNNIIFDFAGHTFAYSQVNGTFSYCLNSWCVKGYFLVLLFFCINNTTLGMGNKVHHGFWYVWGQGKDRSYFGFVIPQLWKSRLEDILFVSICFCTFVISKELQTDYAISGLNSQVYMEVPFKYVYLQEAKVGVMPRLQSPKLLPLKRSFHIHMRCLRCWYNKELSTGNRVGFSWISSAQHS